MYEELRKLTVAQLKQIVREYNKRNQIKGFTKMTTKDQLIAAIMQFNMLIDMVLERLPSTLDLDDATIFPKSRRTLTAMRAQKVIKQENIPERPPLKALTPIKENTPITMR